MEALHVNYYNDTKPEEELRPYLNAADDLHRTAARPTPLLSSSTMSTPASGRPGLPGHSLQSQTLENVCE